MFKYDPNNLDLINDMRKQYKNESNSKHEENLKNSLLNFFPTVNIDNLEKFNPRFRPRNGCTDYYKDKNTNKIYGYYVFGNWKEETNNFN